MLNQDMVNIIFSFVPIITSVRNFARTCKTYHKMTIAILSTIESRYIERYIYQYTTFDAKTGLPKSQIDYSHYCREKFTCELLHDDCARLACKCHIDPDNPFIGDVLIKKGDIILLEIAKYQGCKFRSTIVGLTTDPATLHWAAISGLQIETKYIRSPNTNSHYIADDTSADSHHIADDISADSHATEDTLEANWNSAIDTWQSELFGLRHDDKKCSCSSGYKYEPKSSFDKYRDTLYRYRYYYRWALPDDLLQQCASEYHSDEDPIWAQVIEQHNNELICDGVNSVEYKPHVFVNNNWLPI